VRSTDHLAPRYVYSNFSYHSNTHSTTTNPRLLILLCHRHLTLHRKYAKPVVSVHIIIVLHVTPSPLQCHSELKKNDLMNTSEVHDLLHPILTYIDWLRAGRSGERIPVVERFSAPVQTGPGAHPASCTMGTGSFPGVKSGRGVTLTPHPLLVPWSRKSRSIPLLPLWAVGPVQRLSACSTVHFTLPLLFFPKYQTPSSVQSLP